MVLQDGAKRESGPERPSTVSVHISVIYVRVHVYLICGSQEFHLVFAKKRQFIDANCSNIFVESNKLFTILRVWTIEVLMHSKIDKTTPLDENTVAQDIV